MLFSVISAIQISIITTFSMGLLSFLLDSTDVK